MNALLVGYGRMGKMIEETLNAQGDTVSGIADPAHSASIGDVTGQTDVVIDFSHPASLPDTLAFIKATHTPAVIGTTNLTENDIAAIREASLYAPIVRAANFSLGVAVLKKAAQMVAGALGEDFDIEIVETHHNKKADAPSGTAKALADAIDPENTLPRVYGREGMTGARKREIGMHAVRGGTVAGEHRVMYFGEDEILELRHEAASRRIFAKGACRAARWLLNRQPGLYSMENVLWEE